ncbi:MAG TPA: Uma2 family endonuclease [Isosphaeraceae bacterium]|nr:Uma2 family endonuclease [Isosphaeraceae bacterium]
MSTITTTQPTVLEPLASPALYRITVAEYERMTGVLNDPRVELIDGYLVKKMSKKPPHIWSVTAARKALAALLPAGWSWRKEDPVRIPDFDEPEPDVAVVRGTDEDYRNRIPEPNDVALLVEVTETTQDRDRCEKLAAYARARIPIYWIVDLIDRRIEVYTDPAPEGYRRREDFASGSDVPVVIDGVEVGRIAVAGILG